MTSVFDQFEISTSASGSMTDRVVFGDVAVDTATSNLGYTQTGSVPSLTARRLLGLKSGKTALNPSVLLNRSWAPAWIVEGYASSSFLGRQQNFQRLFSDHELFVDSFVPNPVDIHTTNGFSPTYMDRGTWTSMLATELSGARWGILPYPSGASSVGGTTNTTIQGGVCIAFDGLPKNAGTLAGSSDSTWMARFPYQSTYKALRRNFQFSPFLPVPITVNKNTNNATISPASSSNQLVCMVYNANGDVSNTLIGMVNHPEGFWTSIGGSIYNSRIGTPTIRDLNMLYFGTGNGEAPGNADGIKGPLVRVTTKTFINNNGQQVYMIYSVFPRGYKYGIKAVVPEGTSAIFRSGRYGQVRDMLEQRLYSNFVEKNRISGSPVRYTFVSGTTTYAQSIDYMSATNPSYNTRDSGAWDFEYKAGQPFFDT